MEAPRRYGGDYRCIFHGEKYENKLVNKYSEPRFEELSRFIQDNTGKTSGIIETQTAASQWLESVLYSDKKKRIHSNRVLY